MATTRKKTTAKKKTAKNTPRTKTASAKTAAAQPKAAPARSTARAPARSFTGFPKGGTRFFHELALEQNRDWYNAHKHEYEALWQQPMQALLDALHARLSRVYAPQKLLPPKIYRIHRDVRFAKDKTPYKTNIAGMILLEAPDAGSPMQAPAALYMHFGLEQVAAAGAYVLDGPALARYRAAVDDPKAGAELAAIVERLERDGVRIAAHTTLEKMPRGFSPDHPRAHLLRHKGLMAAFAPVPAKLIASPELVDHLAADAKRVRPLLAWLMTHVTG